MIPGVRRVPEFLRKGSSALDVATVSAGFLGSMSDPFAEGLDRRTVNAPFGDTELPEMRPRVAGQGFAVFEVEAAQLAASFAGWGEGGETCQAGGERAKKAGTRPRASSPPSTPALHGGGFSVGSKFPVFFSSRNIPRPVTGGWWSPGSQANLDQGKATTPNLCSPRPALHPQEAKTLPSTGLGVPRAHPVA